ncbi:MAG: ArsR/SmtB family transcription factor [Sphingobacteriaceae bacterium]
MAINKKEDFSAKDQELANFAKTLSHPARIAIIRMLAEQNSCICGEIVEVLPLAQSTVSQHLKDLQAAGLVKGTIDGQKSCYCINWENLEQLSSEFTKLFGNLQKQKNCNCC